MGQLGKSPQKEVIGFFLAFYLLLFVSVIYFLTVSTVKNHWYLPNKKPDWFLLQTAWSVNPFYHHTNQTLHLKKKKMASLTKANSPGAQICLSVCLGHRVVGFQAIYRFICGAKIFSTNQSRDVANEVGEVFGEESLTGWRTLDAVRNNSRKLSLGGQLRCWTAHVCEHS